MRVQCGVLVALWLAFLATLSRSEVVVPTCRVDVSATDRRSTGSRVQGAGDRQAWNSTSENQGASHNTSATYDLLVLSMRWPFSACAFLGSNAGAACSSPPAAFVVGGLRPGTLKGAPPMCCGSGLESLDREFSLVPISDIAPQLLRLWPDFRQNESTIDMWRLYWQRYGSCTSFSLRTYFRKILVLSRRFDFLRALSAEGVVASGQRVHDQAVVQRAVNTAVGGFHVCMSCRAANNVVILRDIRVCLNKQGTRPIDCPEECGATTDEVCDPGRPLRIPFWRHEKTGPAPDEAPEQDDDSPEDGDSATTYWIRQSTEFAVLIAAISFAIYKQCLERHSNRSTEGSYQRIL